MSSAKAYWEKELARLRTKTFKDVAINQTFKFLGSDSLYRKTSSDSYVYESDYTHKGIRSWSFDAKPYWQVSEN